MRAGKRERSRGGGISPEKNLNVGGAIPCDRAGGCATPVDGHGRAYAHSSPDRACDAHLVCEGDCASSVYADANLLSWTSPYVKCESAFIEPAFLS